MEEGSLGVGLGIKWIILCAGPSEGGNGEIKSLKSKKVLLLNKLCFSTGVSAAFAVKLFKSWINEKDINAVAASLRKVSMDNRLMVCDFSFFLSWQHLRKMWQTAFPFLICEKRESVFLEWFEDHLTRLNFHFRNFFLPINKALNTSQSILLRQAWKSFQNMFGISKP